MNPYYIIEVANTHGGDLSYLEQVIESFEDIHENIGIKFQIFGQDTIATTDYKSYNLYGKLQFDLEIWARLIERASKTKDVWLDVFDTYGIQAFEQNSDRVLGLKLQSSVLFNFEVIAALKHQDLSTKKLILNVAGHSLDDIKKILSTFSNDLNPGEILLEFGFQSYPTLLRDSGICKINSLRKKFNNRLVFADHVDGRSKDAIYLPAVAVLLGVEVIEKHVMLENRPTEYDHFSSIYPNEFKEMIQKSEEFSLLSQGEFLNDAEIAYLTQTRMKPILKHKLTAGSIPSLEQDFVFRRSPQDGLTVNEIQTLLDSKHLLKHDVEAHRTLKEADFKPARVGLVIVSRLKSTRLKEKAKLLIGDLSSLEFCLKNALLIENIDSVSLATTTNKEDQELENYKYSEEVGFYQGSEEDVMARILDVCDAEGLDIVSRITADMPYQSNEIYQQSLNAHFAKGADYTRIEGAPIGLAPGIITVAAMKKAKEFFPSAKYSEYLSFYFKNNAEVFKYESFHVAKEFRANFRLTLDYQEDLDMLNKLNEIFKPEEVGPNYTGKLLEVLASNAEISNINMGLEVVYKDNSDFIRLLDLNTTISEVPQDSKLYE